MRFKKYVLITFVFCALSTVLGQPGLANPDDPRFGFRYSVIPAYARGMPYGGPRGLTIIQVAPGSPAESIGIVPGDVIEFSNGDAINSQNLPFMMQNSKAGDLFYVTVERGDAAYTHSITSTMESTISTKCDKLQAKAEFDFAIESDHKRDISAERAHARMALNRYEACYFENNTDGFDDLLKIGDSFILLGVSYRREHGGSNSQDIHFLSLAHSLYRAIISLDNVGPNVTASAQRKLAVIEQAAPNTRMETGRSALFDEMLQQKKAAGKAQNATDQQHQ